MWGMCILNDPQHSCLRGQRRGKVYTEVKTMDKVKDGFSVRHHAEAEMDRDDRPTLQNPSSPDSYRPYSTPLDFSVLLTSALLIGYH
jgi:hypothetical protein